MLRQAQIAKYLNPALRGCVSGLAEKRHDQLLDIARHALALQQFRRKNAARRDHPRNLCGLPRLEGENPDEAESYQRQFDEAAALKFLKEPKTSKGSPQPRLCPLHAGRIPDASDACKS